MRVQSLFCRLGLGAIGVAIMLASIGSGAGAQTSTGSVRGYVTDSARAPLAGARVDAVSVLTGTSRGIATDARGFYALVGLVPGAYDVTARHIGMAAQKVRVQVLIGEVFPLDFRLGANPIEIAGVTVAASSGLETRTSEVATNLTQQQIEQLPTSSRNFLDLAALAPGLTVSPDRISLAPRNFSYGASGPGEANVFIDGASLKNDITGGEGSNSGIAGQDNSRGNPFPRNAVQEYRVLTQNFKAEYQQASGAIITATTKSGGNFWTGDAFVEYQNQGLVALDSISDATPGFKKPDYNRYLVGLSGGGPLIKDRLRFFGSYEGNYQNRDATVLYTPPAAGLFPALDTVGFNKYQGNFGSPFRETLVFGKLSYTVNDRSSAELSVNDRHETDVRDFGGTSLASYQGANNYINDVALGTLKYSYFTGPWLNEAAVTYEHFERNPSPATAGIPARWFALPSECCVTLGSNVSAQDFVQKRLAFRDDITYTGFHGGGEHVMKAGVSVASLAYDITKANNQTPQFFYSDQVNCNPNCTGAESYAYRTPYIMQWATGTSFVGAHNAQIGAYIQDDWSPSSRLTLNLGIRWDFESHMFNYDYVTPTDVVDSITKYNSTLQHPIDPNEYFTDGTQRHKFYGAFQPRVGFSYALDQENKTTLFGGFGIYYDRSFFDISVDETLKLTRPFYTVFFADPDSTPKAGQVAWNNSYFTTNPTTLNNLVATSQAAGKEVWLIGNNTKAPHSAQWNVGVRRLFGDVLVSAAYVGVRGYDGFVFNWANLEMNAKGQCCVGGGFGHGFTNIIYGTNSVKTWYDAFQLQVTRPYRKEGKWSWGAGLAYSAGTHYLQGIDNPDDEFAFPNAADIVKHRTNDETSRLVANWTMDVPYAAGVQFGGLITLGTGVRSDIGSRFNGVGGPYISGGFSPPQYAFIIPGAWAYREVDLRLSKDFPSISGRTMGVTVDLFNVFNFNNFSYGGGPTPNGLLSDPRRLQIGAAFHF